MQPLDGVVLGNGVPVLDAEVRQAEIEAVLHELAMVSPAVTVDPMASPGAGVT